MSSERWSWAIASSVTTLTLSACYPVWFDETVTAPTIVRVAVTVILVAMAALMPWGTHVLIQYSRAKEDALNAFLERCKQRDAELDRLLRPHEVQDEPEDIIP